MGKAEVVIFDMYGVIMKDPVGGLLPFVKGVFPELGFDEVYSQWLIGNVGGLSSMDFFRNLGFAGDLRAVEKAYLDSLEIDEAFYAAAARLKKRYRLALLSNDLSEWSRYLREIHGLDALLDAAVVSGEVGIKKPDAQIYKILLNKLGSRPSDCIYVDDRKNNLDAAKSLGMDTVLFNNGRAFHDGGKGNAGYAGKMAGSFQELADMLLL